jgi:hypothetical protein
MARKEPKISELKHRIALCTMKDVVIDQEMHLSREAVTYCWANIEHMTNMASFLSRAGYAIMENAQRPTHRITVRAGLDLEYSSAAWVYEQRLRSPPRWYKVLGFVDECDWVMLECHLVEKSDNVQPVDSALTAAPQDVVL